MKESIKENKVLDMETLDKKKETSHRVSVSRRNRKKTIWFSRANL